MDATSNTAQAASAHRAPIPGRTATLIGFCAVMLWGTLATLTTLKGGDIPPFQSTAITFAVGGATIALYAIAVGRSRAMVPTLPSFLLGIYGLFVFHVLYFAALKFAPPAEAGLIASLWALLTVLFSGFLPGVTLSYRHVVGALMGFTAAALLVFDKLGASAGHPDALLGFSFAFASAVVWATYSVMSRTIAAVPSESVAPACFATALLALACNLLFEGWVAPSAPQWIAMVFLGLGPIGAAFMLWDIGMKQGNVAFLGVLGYASPVISTALLILLGLAAPTWVLVVSVTLIMIAARLAAPRRRKA
ncbi:DMT family transporter [Pseudorhodoplanes sp.]|uniref:DMT family transporter n=1 Tax=Pseudorhodoplanes sp. TaxID=1934341 RepID=UPI002D0EBBDC|nr:EamA family transporter [Pseudorhodoplanes sp.]HWV42716.1 EamA family transporter [Pseudorhodoplanes sp.]